jgi:hypothetical protein
MNRRDFLQTASAVALASVAEGAPPPTPKTIGIQVGAVSFVDEGVEQVLDIFQKEAYINTMFVATFTYGRGIAGRQAPGQPLPGHGKQQYDNGSGPGTLPPYLDILRLTTAAFRTGDWHMQSRS